MSDMPTVPDLLHEASETHHIVYRIVDGDDPDWASWYAGWLLSHSELPQLLGPHRSAATSSMRSSSSTGTTRPSSATSAGRTGTRNGCWSSSERPSYSPAR